MKKILSPNTIIQNLQSKDSLIKTEAFSNIKILGDSFKEEKFRKEVLPYIINCIDIEDEISTLEITKKLNVIIECIGGRKYINDIFPLIEIIFHCDDLEVRKELMETLNDIFSNIKFYDIEKEVVDLINKLYDSEELNLEIGCLDLISISFDKFRKEKNKTDILEILDNFIESDVTMIKVKFSQILKNIIKYLEKEDIEDFFNKLIQEESDSIRINLIDSLLSLKTIKNIIEYDFFIQDSIEKLSDDESWRTRLTVAKNFSSLLGFIPLLKNEDFKIFLIDTLYNLISDDESEVKSSICYSLESCCKILSNDNYFNKIFEKLKDLCNDNIVFVRESLANNLLLICNLIDKNKFQKYIIPIFTLLIKDNELTVRMIIMNNLDKFNKNFQNDFQFFQTIIPYIKDVAKSEKWRLRVEILETISIFSKVINKTIFLDNLSDLIFDLLKDPVYEVRKKMSENLKSIFENINDKNFNNKLIEKFNEMSLSENYLIRNTINFSILELLNDKKHLDFIENNLIDLIIKLSKDNVPNIRYNSVIILKKIMKISSQKKISDIIRNRFRELKNETDIEVIYALNDK